MLGEDIVGVVKVLLVKVCPPVRVTTDESISRVSASPTTADVNPVPPAILKISPELTADHISSQYSF